MTVQFNNQVPEAAGLTLPVTDASGKTLGHLHCINTGSCLKWFAAMVNGPTGNAKVGREAAAADVLAWASGQAPAYLMQGLPAGRPATLYAWQPTPFKPTFWQRLSALFQ